MFCTNCGNHNPDGTEKCAFCGSPMNVEPIQQPDMSQPYQAAQYDPSVSQPYAPQPYAQQPYTQQPYAQQPYVQPVAVPGKGLGIAALVLGIVSLVFMCVFYISIPTGIAGLIMGCVSNSKAKAQGLKNGMAVGGIVCSAIGLALSVIIIVLAAIGISSAYGAMSGYGF